MRIQNYDPEMKLLAPINGQTTNLKAGALVGKLVTSPSTQNGHLELFTGTSALANAFGVLREPHTATGNDVDVAGTTYNYPGLGSNVYDQPSSKSLHPVEPIAPMRIAEISYSTASADLIAATQAVTTTALTLTSLENNIAAGWLYVVSGTGAGQLFYLTASGAGSATLKTAPSVALDTTSKLIKILPTFHLLGSLTADGTKLSSQAAAGALQIAILQNWITLQGERQVLNPATMNGLTNLNNDPTLKFESDICFRDSIVYNGA